MGICHCSKSNQGEQKQVKVKIGGGEDGTCTWKVYRGVTENNLVTTSGWEMKFELAANGTISGGNKNDNEEGAQKKLYAGTLKNGILDCIATFEDGAQIKYDGQMDGSIMKVTCKVIKGSNKFHQGDIADCVGPVKYD
ncbi:unnamed protein product [Paramecium pentaurelia]|uniref:Uncharacterized protein n=1 Tax=Paramecium pentaurelia TaxID=43138 RepID=A0A8S1UXU0_9CILI|nr:unnamed protein product [Paramecium pentaurelia]